MLRHKTPQHWNVEIYPDVVRIWRNNINAVYVYWLCRVLTAAVVGRYVDWGAQAIVECQSLQPPMRGMFTGQENQQL
jgi:hypothetical protein